MLLNLTLALVVAFTAPVAARDRPRVWRPAPDSTWQWQLTGTVDRGVDADVFDIDGFDSPRALVRALHRSGRRVVCYVSAGSWERWRPDAARFPRPVLGRPLDGWPGERWLDIRRLDVLGPLLARRLDMCRAKGFDAVEPDNVDGYTHRTGFPLTARHQLRFNRWLARAAHARGLSIALKNDLGQARALEPHFDFALNEECFAFDECERLLPFVHAGKAVFTVEYDLPPERFCPRARRLGFMSMHKDRRLGARRTPCWR